MCVHLQNFNNSHLTFCKINLNKSWHKSYESMTQICLNYAKNIMVERLIGQAGNKIWDLV